MCFDAPEAGRILSQDGDIWINLCKGKKKEERKKDGRKEGRERKERKKRRNIAFNFSKIPQNDTFP